MLLLQPHREELLQLLVGSIRCLNVPFVIISVQVGVTLLLVQQSMELRTRLVMLALEVGPAWNFWKVSLHTLVLFMSDPSIQC